MVLILSDNSDPTTSDVIDSSEVRYKAGLIKYFEYLTEKNNYLKSQNEASALKYDLWFKKLLVERFKNGGLFKMY
jgi:outer membrane protein TolC